MFQAYRGQRFGAAADVSNQFATRYAMPGQSVREGAFAAGQRRIAGDAASDIGQFQAQLKMQQAQEVPGAAYLGPLLQALAPQGQFAALLANLWSGGAAGLFNLAGQQAIGQGQATGGAFQGLGTAAGGIFAPTPACWIAEAVFGPAALETHAARYWMLFRAPRWLLGVYQMFGRPVAWMVQRSSWLRRMFRPVFLRAARAGIRAMVG